LATCLKIGVCPKLMHLNLSENNIDLTTKSKVYKSFNISSLQKGLFKLKYSIKLLEHNIEDIHAYNLIGNMFCDLKEENKAAKYFKAVNNSKMVLKIFELLFKQNPKDADLLVGIGNYYLGLGKLTKSVEYYNKAKNIEKNPSKHKIIENKILKAPGIYENKLDEYAQKGYNQLPKTFLNYEQLESDIQDINIELAGLTL
jgi:tetratricopeptide (TPR) repeat protein